MTTTRFLNDRLTIATLAIAALLPFLAVSPVKAAPAASCAAEAQALRAEAATAAPEEAARLLRTVNIAERICAEGNRFEATKKFAAVRSALSDNIQLAKR